MNKKGFFFIVLAFLFVVYVLFSVDSMSRVLQYSSERAAERFRANQIEMIGDSLSQDSYNHLSQIITHGAIQRMLAHSSQGNTIQPAGADGLDGVKSAFRSVVLYGYAEEFAPDDLVYSSSDNSTYTFSGYIAALEKTLNEAGYDLVSYSFNASISEMNYTHLNITTELSFIAVEKNGFSSFEKHYKSEEHYSIEGLYDPYIARRSRNVLESNPSNPMELVYRQVWFGPYEAPEDLRPEIVAGPNEIYSGQGWFYGPAIYATAVTTAEPFERNRTILVGTYSQIMNVQGWNEFGAFIVTSLPETEPASPPCQSYENEENTLNPITYENSTSSGGCHATIAEGEITRKPFVVVKDFEISSERSGDFYPYLIVSDKSPERVINHPEYKFDTVGVYDVEKLRDFLMCTYYVHSERSPSFLQRFLSNGAIEAMEGSQNGIETLLVGMWAGGSMSKVSYENATRYDIDFFVPVEGTRIRGMPGCRNVADCSATITIGHFALDEESIDLYLGNARDIACDRHADCIEEEQP
ncbi:MAG: hypothetical protein QW035_04220 [Candidatus Anstonellales archaeon]